MFLSFGLQFGKKNRDVIKVKPRDYQYSSQEKRVTIFSLPVFAKRSKTIFCLGI
jgi:hypothetical protein